MTMTEQTPWRSAWESALDDLELTLEETQRLLSGGDPAAVTASPAWSPPELPSPLPPELVHRARSLLARQQELIGLTAAAMAGTRQSIVQLGRVSGFAGSRRSEPAVYLDIRA